MRDYRDAKAMAQALRDNLKSKNITLSVAESLELVAKQFGFDNWNILAAKVTDTGACPQASEGVGFPPQSRSFVCSTSVRRRNSTSIFSALRSIGKATSVKAPRFT